MKNFEDILKDNGLRFGQFLDAKGQEDITSFFDTMLADRGGVLSDAEIDEILKNYQSLGVIEPDDGIERTQEEALAQLGEALKNSGLSEWLNTGYEMEHAADRHQEAMAGAADAAKAGSPASGSTAEQGHRQAGFDHYGNQTAAEDIRRTNPPHTDTSSPVAASAGSVPGTPGSAGRPKAVCTYQLVMQDNAETSTTHPLMILRDPEHQLPHHQAGAFTNPERRTAFEYSRDQQIHSADILFLDRRFVNLLRWLGEGHIAVMLSGGPVREGYAILKIRAIDVNSNESLQTANNDFLQLVIRRLLASRPKEKLPEEVQEEVDNSDASMLLSDMPAMIDYLNCAEDSLPDNIRNWAHRNIAMVKSNTISEEEKRHAQRALSIMLNIQWMGSYFEPIDPEAARRILDEELYGLERVKQRVIETIIQINRTHTLPSYGLLLAGPAGTGKSQIAYAVARILKLPWTSLDMSAIHDTEALTGSPRVYSNAKPGRIMEAFQQAGQSNLVFIINELDKADAMGAQGNPADALLTLLDNLGFTDNYMECQIPTGGVYPIATANDKTRISDPLLTRFAVIDIPDYTADEKKIIFRRYALPKVLRRMGMTRDECQIDDEAVDVIIDMYSDLPGVRDLEQAAEHMAANALFQIEAKGKSRVVFDAAAARSLLQA